MMRFLSKIFGAVLCVILCAILISTPVFCVSAQGKNLSTNDNATEEKDNILSISLTLNEALAINIYAENSIDKVDFLLKNTVTTVENFGEAVGKRKFTFSCLGPKMMTEDITVIAYSNGNEISEKTVSIKDYLNTLLSDEKYKNIAEATLMYGSAAQIYENYRTDNLANGKSESETNALLAETNCGFENIFSVEYPENFDENSEDLPVKWVGAQAILSDKISLRFYAECEDGFNGCFVNLSVSGSQRTVPITWIPVSETKSYIDIPLTPSELKSPIKIYAKTDMNTVLSKELTYSVETYAGKIFEQTNNIHLKNLIISLMNYSDAAVAVGG